MLDPQQRVQVWNRRAEDLWGLRPDEAVDNHFLSLDIGLPSEQLAPALRAVLGGSSERESRELEAVNRRGRTIVCAATVLPLVGPVPGDGTRVRGAIVLMENRPAAAATGERRRERLARPRARAGRARGGAAAKPRSVPPARGRAEAAARSSATSCWRRQRAGRPCDLHAAAGRTSACEDVQR